MMAISPSLLPSQLAPGAASPFKGIISSSIQVGNIMVERQKFLPGMELAERFFEEVVEPIIGELNPDLSYSAGLIGPGSEVLGFDNEMSSDHHWGPRVMIFLKEDEYEQLSGSMKVVLSHKLPHRFLGYPTSFTPAGGDTGNACVQLLDYDNEGLVNHRVEIYSFSQFIESYIGVGSGLNEPLKVQDWLVIPQQKLRSLKSGRLFRDDLELSLKLSKIDYYPHDLWLYLLASCWMRIEQAEHLMGRAGDVGDEIGSSLIAAGLVRDLMRLSFFMEKQYPPYEKWFGTAFGRLKIAMFLKPHLESTLKSETWQDRERCLAKAYKVVAEQHNELGITAPLPVEARPFHDRPYKVISMGDYSSAIKQEIKDADVLKLTQTRLLGNVDLMSDSTDVSESLFAQGVFKQLYI